MRWLSRSLQKATCRGRARQVAESGGTNPSPRDSVRRSRRAGLSGAPGSREPGTGISEGLAAGDESSAAQEARNRARLNQRVANAVADEVVHQRLLTETYLGFSRVNVDVDFLRRHFQKEQDHWRTGGRDDVAVGLGDGVQQKPVANKPLVDEDVDGVAVELLQLGLGVEAAERRSTPGVRDGSSGSRFHGGGSGRPACSNRDSAATGNSCASVSLPKI